MHQWSNTIALYFFKPTHALLLHTVSICMSSSFAGVCVCDHLQIWCLELCVDRSWPQNLVAGAFFLALWTHHECLPDRRPGAGHHGDDCELLRKGRSVFSMLYILSHFTTIEALGPASSEHCLAKFSRFFMFFFSLLRVATKAVMEVTAGPIL